MPLWAAQRSFRLMYFKAFPAGRINSREFWSSRSRLVGFLAEHFSAREILAVSRGPGSACINGRVAGLSFISPNDQSSSQFAVNYSALKSWGPAQAAYGGIKMRIAREIRNRIQAVAAALTIML